MKTSLGQLSFGMGLFGAAVLTTIIRCRTFIAEPFWPWVVLALSCFGSCSKQPFILRWTAGFTSRILPCLCYQ